jgi:predicted nucleic acid-binding protein
VERLIKILMGKDSGVTDAPAGPARIHPVEAARIVTENILPYFEVVALGKEDCLEALNTMGSGGWVGAKIYDALLLACAARCAVERIYAFNLGDFRRLAPAGLQEKICGP